MSPEEEAQMRSHHLTPEQYKVWTTLVHTNIRDLPPRLLTYLEDMSRRYGMSGDMMVECIAMWIRNTWDG